ncbi:DUF3817 domain-containing protein [Microbacterium sp. cx-55]|uniref:DUF3817 domain-containing protein n=1 Tax=Microbacterium sp. cx-55 TaxID=2875948 RepID=UPI001CC151E1|nr:DUF3817 domain-containing protein [Microbacterium sp. cx-55]MBZ4486941.1 DUF3817 domain-containing protein [Microbacterium sp. cx-55]UGB35860.1 DUF3817 domain-containing protein [Microbacterium sp. cx-55]
MPQPKLATFPAIRGALRFYQICSIITGVGLLLLVTEMILKYTPLAVEVFAGGSGGALWLAPVIAGPEGELVSTGDGVNLSLAILIIHGWFYVVYLFACFRVWSLMRWPFWRFLLLAAGGVVPFLSFVMEWFVARDVKHYLAVREAAEAVPASAAATESPR